MRKLTVALLSFALFAAATESAEAGPIRNGLGKAKNGVVKVLKRVRHPFGRRG